MKAFQPWSDTINLLASGTVTGTFELEEVVTSRKQRRIRNFVTAGVTRLLLIIGIT